MANKQKIKEAKEWAEEQAKHGLDIYEINLTDFPELTKYQSQSIKYNAVKKYNPKALRNRR
jgi:hypothetical protein